MSSHRITLDKTLVGSELFEILHFFGCQFKVENIDVLRNARWSLAFRYHDDSTLDTMSKEDLTRCLFVLLSNLTNDWFINKTASRRRRSIWAAKGTICGHQHAVGTCEIDKLCIREVGMAFHLQHSWFDCTVVKDAFQLAPVEIRDTYRPAEALTDEILHGPPCLQQVCVVELYTPISVKWTYFVTRLVGSRPVHEVQVEVV
uniref:Uncharacterized protein n=1 Tax=Schistocephalus solidus TaxID=70667 RepID=A0A0V0J801_SCHSO